MAEARELVTAEEIAERVRVQPDTVKGWGRRGIIPAVRISRQTVRFDLDAVLQALRNRGRRYAT